MDTINPLSAILPVGATASQGRGHSHGQQLPAAGQILKAVVLEANGENRFVLDIGGNRLTASSEAKLTPGQILQLQVTKTEPHIELKIVTNTLNRFAGRSLTLLGNNIDLGELFTAVRNVSPPPLQLLTPTSSSVLENFFSLQQSSLGEKDGGAILKQLIDSLGLNLEHLLARGDKQAAIHTLKAALLEMAHSFSSAEQLAEATQKVLTTLELFQFAQLQTGSISQFIFPLPLPFIEQGYLIIEQEKEGNEKGGSKAEENHFSLHLTMSDLGNLRINFLRNAEGLFIRFHADSQEKADFIATHGGELKAAISNIPLISLAFSTDASDPISDLIRQITPEGSSMLDTKV
ncbi:MAG: hypothetical protein KJ630_24845 [Proteobacteria bacterium]|nr:hypothetical protein [Pseudomonadota bacterium]